MNDDRDRRAGRVPLPPVGGPDEGAKQIRAQGLRRVRRLSNWTAAALIVGTGATAAALAHGTVPVSLPGTPSAPGNAAGPSTAGVGTGSVYHGASGPQVGHSVATTSASGVTTTTTTRVVNGRTVVTQVQHVPAHHDD